MNLSSRDAPGWLPGFAFFVLSAGTLAAQGGCGSNAGPGTSGEVGTYVDGGESFVGGDGGISGALEAGIERNGIAVTFVTLSCAGDCADVEAVASGGHPPYRFAWDDASTNATRRVCPTSTTSYRVKVTDAGTAGELATPPETAEASLTADLLACPDAGPGAEAGAGALCVMNPSFEGTAQIDVADVVAPPWHTCDPYPDLLDGTNGGIALLPSDGKTYVDMQYYPSESSVSESIGQPLCAPLRAGDTAHVAIDVAGQDSDTFTVQFYGAATECQEDQLLGQTTPVTGGLAWTTECVTLQAQADVSFLKIRLGNAQTSLGVMGFIDNLRAVSSCP
jgi:hypothetical protein